MRSRKLFRVKNKIQKARNFKGKSSLKREPFYYYYLKHGNKI